MKKVLVLIIFVLIFSLFDVAAEEHQRGLGFTAGNVSGIGFAYRQYFDKNGMQFTFGMLSSRDKTPKFPDTIYNSSTLTKKGWEVDGWLSAMYLHTVRESEFTKFYLFLGSSMKIDYTEKYTQAYVKPSSSHNYEITGEPVKTRHNNNDYFFGPGIGLDYQINDYISLIVELPISISSKKKIETYIPQGALLVRF